MGIFSSKKPPPIPKFFGQAAKESAADYGELRQLWQNLQPHIARYAQQYQNAIPNIIKHQKNYVQELGNLQGRANSLGTQGANLEQQTLRELQETGSQQRQDDFGLRSNERFAQNLQQAQEAHNAYAAQRGTARTFSSAAEQAAGATVAENEARRAEQYRGENVRQQNLGAFGQLAQTPAMHQALTANAHSGIAATQAGAAQGLTGINALNSGFYNDQVSPALGQAQSGAANLYDAQVKRAEALANRKAAKLGNIGRAIGTVAGFAIGGPAGASLGASLGGGLGGGGQGGGGGGGFNNFFGGQNFLGGGSQTAYGFGGGGQSALQTAPTTRVPYGPWTGGSGPGG